MQKNSLLIIFLLVAFTVGAQGLKFTTASNWNAVLEEAKSSNKYIFIDGYATWCKPCKLMEAEAFQDPKVGELMNPKFIAVRVQVDQTPDDNSYVKAWYDDAAMLNLKYQFGGLPAQIILSPDGEILYQHSGYNGIDKFIDMIKFAIDPKANNFREQISAYKIGKKDYSTLPTLIKAVHQVLKDKELTHEMARDYFENYLDKQDNPTTLVTSENISVALADLEGLKPDDRLILSIRKMRPKTADSIARQFQGTSKILIQYAIQNVELENNLWENGKVINTNPNFQKYEDIISRKYPDVDAKEIVFIYQRGYVDGGGFYRRTRNQKMMNKVIDKEINNSLAVNDFGIVNNWCWFTYFYAINDKSSLKLAVNWMDRAINQSKSNTSISIHDKANLYDTKAALLYKLGHRKMAIETENEGAAILQADNVAKGVDKDRGCKSFFEVIEQMKNGEKIAQPNAIFPSDWKLLD